MRSRGVAPYPRQQTKRAFGAVGMMMLTVAFLVGGFAPGALAEGSAGDGSSTVNSANTADSSLELRGPFTPRAVVLPTGVRAITADEVTLFDSDGAMIPLTGRQVTVDDDGTTAVLLPKLSEGTYLLRYPGGERELLIGTERAPIGRDLETSGNGGDFFAVTLLGTGAMLAMLLLVRRRMLPGLLVLGGTIAGGALLLLSPVDSLGQVSAPDPCSVVRDWGVRENCMYDHILETLDRDGVRDAVARLEYLVATPNSLWPQSCHEVAHYLGQLGWRQVASLEDAVKVGTVSCSFGYFHGMLESMGTYLDDATFAEQILTVCPMVATTFFPDDASGNAGPGRECVHGIGHASMWRTNEDLPRAVPVCAALQAEPDREECIAGATMSWIFAREQARAEGTERDLPLPRVATPLELCAPPYGEATPGCVEGALTGTTFEEYTLAVAWCAERDALAATCASTLVRRLVYWENNKINDLVGAAQSLCQELATNEYLSSTCIERFSWLHMYRGREYETTRALCARTYQLEACLRGIALFYDHARTTGDKSVGAVPAGLPDVATD
jgi:hypothetical protein